MSIQFHETVMGHNFYQHQLPKLIKAVERLASAMEEANKLEAAKEAARKEHSALAANNIVPVIEGVNKALAVYSPEHVDVVENDHGMLDVIWHSKDASFPIEQNLAAVDAVNLDALIKALDALGVGHCF